jgi:3'-phosphoadenosine 5'-phosphosulfate synthase
MREGVLLQALHFNSLLIDPLNDVGAKELNFQPTNWNTNELRGRRRVSMAVPIVLPITGFTKAAIETSSKGAVAMLDKDGRVLGLLKNPEIYLNRKEEIVSRCFGAIDSGHPYIAHLYSGGNYLLGGEIEVFEPVRYGDGLDKWRLTPKELYTDFKAKGADVVFAFQTRNPTHAGHAYLMRTGRERLVAAGFKNPVLWLSPLGGWTKADDVPLDVRVTQHQAVLDERMLDPNWTVMGIWPAPMIYAGPTEVQFHAASRRAAGASFFVVGRDAAGIKGSVEATWSPDDDMYDANHARFALQMSPVLEDGQMSLLSFDKFYYDKSDHQMKAMDPMREDDFISISGSKMRKLAAQGATPCTDPIPSDLLAANCVPQGFMVPSGWAIVCNYYQNIDSPNWIPWSKAVVKPLLDINVVPRGTFGKTDFAIFLTNGDQQLSPWHDISLVASESYASSISITTTFNMVTEIPMYTSAKMEVMKDKWSNPIMQDTNKDGSTRYYTYGVPFFNYGLLPQTWEDPNMISSEGFGGDNDPLDVIEIGATPLPMGSVTQVKVLGSLELIDEGETDHKIIALRISDSRAKWINDMNDLEQHIPGLTSKLVDWLKMYKTSDGKAINTISNHNIPTSVPQAIEIITECHAKWLELVASGTTHYSNLWLGSSR